MDVVDQLHVRIHGLVQGVGFRYAALHEAFPLQLTGWVRNVPGGAVEAVFEGERKALERMLRWCEDGPPYARVDHIEATWSQGKRRYDRFRIQT